jgi:predicted amidophosphoribosyltransferase
VASLATLAAPTLLRHLRLPLRRVALCLDCDERFDLGVSTCPACGSETWSALARFLEVGIRSASATAGAALAELIL